MSLNLQIDVDWEIVHSKVLVVKCVELISSVILVLFGDEEYDRFVVCVRSDYRDDVCARDVVLCTLSL